MDQITYRLAEEKDIDVLLGLIKELAEYEKMTDQVLNSPELMREWFFKKQAAQAFLAEVDGEAVGMAIFFRTYSTFVGKGGIHLEDLFVKKAFRGQGIGKTLLKKVAAVAVTEGCGRMEWNCLNWNTPSIEFYHSLGAIPLSEWTYYRLAGKTLETVAKPQ